MYETASPTVLRFCTSSSGIFTPNFSSAATTTSTIDSESTSRSSVNDLPSATSSGLTPATSSRISARPATISSRVVMSVGSFRWGALRAADDLSGVGEATAEAEQQDRGARGHLAPFDQLRQRQRHTGRGGVARLDDVLGDDRVGQVEPLGDTFDDPQVRLVGDEGLDVARFVAGPLDGLQRERGEGGGGPA